MTVQLQKRILHHFLGIRRSQTATHQVAIPGGAHLIEPPGRLLITDIKMPRMDGIALARAVAKVYPTIPVLFISGWSDPLEEPEWQKPGYAFLRKPFLPKVLINSIEELLARSTARAAAHG